MNDTILYAYWLLFVADQSLQNAAPCEVRARAVRVVKIYRDNDIAGEDAGVSGYIACLPREMRAVYDAACMIAEQTRVCSIHGEIMRIGYDGLFRHLTGDEDSGFCSCYGPNNAEQDEAFLENVDALCEMPELVYMGAHI